MDIKNLKVFAAGLCMGISLIVTGCSNGTKISLDNSKIEYNYDDNEITGNITFEDLNKYGKVVTIEDNGEMFTRLLIKREERIPGGRASRASDYIKYIDLETGAVLIYSKKYLNSEEEILESGKDLKIVSEIGIVSYLVNNNFVKTDYTVEELIGFVNDMVIPSLDLDKKELVK